MRIGIIELLVDKRLDGPLDGLYGLFLRKQFVSIGPQVVAVWCRQLGHEVTYTTYWGQRDPRSLLPSPLDVVFIATYTPSSALAYALAKLFRREKMLTVIGGPHAKAFPDDCLRFFDVVVKECDKRLIDTILRGDSRGRHQRPLADRNSQRGRTSGRDRANGVHCRQTARDRVHPDVGECRLSLQLQLLHGLGQSVCRLAEGPASGGLALCLATLA